MNSLSSLDRHRTALTFLLRAPSCRLRALGRGERSVFAQLVSRDAVYGWCRRDTYSEAMGVTVYCLSAIRARLVVQRMAAKSFTRPDQARINPDARRRGRGCLAHHKRHDTTRGQARTTLRPMGAHREDLGLAEREELGLAELVGNWMERVIPSPMMVAPLVVA